MLRIPASAPAPRRPRPGRPAPLGAVFLLLAAGCAPARPAPPLLPAPAEPERLGDTGLLLGEEIRPVSPEVLGRVEYDLPLEANSWVQTELDFLVAQRPDILARWLERGDLYASFIERTLRDQGLPTDLFHLAMIESGFVPVARSRAGAVGIWQFMPATARAVGLRVDELVDERIDPVRSTRAAALHLRSLFRIYGDWALATAAYNAGSGRISRGMDRFGATNFWDLAERGDLAAETRHYVPRLYAVTIVGRDRERFGFAPARRDLAFAFDSVHVARPVPLTELAELGGMNPLHLSELNPHLLEGRTPDGGYWVWVPPGTAVELQRAYLAAEFRRETPAPAYAAATREPPPAGGTTVHTVGPGDTLWDLARRYGVSVGEIQQANGLAGSTIRTGQRLRIPGADDAAGNAGAPRAGDGTADSGTADSPTADNHTADNGPANGGAGAVEHVVVPGDTLWGIARRYGSTIEAIQRANGLGERPIVPGQRLAVPQPGD